MNFRFAARARMVLTDVESIVPFGSQAWDKSQSSPSILTFSFIRIVVSPAVRSVAAAAPGQLQQSNLRHHRSSL